MDPATRKSLTTSLGKLSAEIAAAVRQPMLQPGSPVRARAERLHQEERVGEPFEVWTDLLSRRAAVLWVLKSLYVRVLEDRGLLRPGRILDTESQELFAHLAPSLGDTAYLRWVYRDLASARGGLPELFAPQAAEIVAPPDGLSRKLIDFWRSRDPDNSKLLYAFDEEHFDGRLMGDVYQDLDPVVKKRYALLQTPDFVIDFILDETLTPAIAEWGVEAVRVLDPACGSGHFLLAAFKRLFAGMREKFPVRPMRVVVEDVLGRVVGIDLNDYACALARARLVMTALEACGESDLGAGGELHPQVYWADALEQMEREQLGLFKSGRPAASLTRPEVRAALAPVLQRGFHVVVGNPPYITEKDATKREYHKEKIGKGRRYVSASGKYSLGAPFTERMLQLAVADGVVGEITADSFMKREFGKALIEQVLAKRELTKVVSTAGAFIPGHGTPTVILFARNRPSRGEHVRVVMGKRGEPGKPEEPAKGRVWTSITEGHAKVGYENEFISVADVPRTTMSSHPWSIGGGGAAELKEGIEQQVELRLGAVAADIGITSVTGEDDVYAQPEPHVFARLHVAPTRPLVVGEDVRDWSIVRVLDAVWPYENGHCVARLDAIPSIHRYAWRYKPIISKRRRFGTPMLERGLTWYEWQELYVEKLRTESTITWGEVSTHNHFALDRGGKVFKQTAPVIKLPPGATEAQHLVLLAQLNSSTACFWLKQVCQNKGVGGRGSRGLEPDEWEKFYQFGGTKLESFPLIATAHTQLESFARHMDTLAGDRVTDSARSVLDAHASSGPAALRAALSTRREHDLDRLFKMVSLQEELDWLCYKLYGIDPEAEIRDPERVPPLRPGLRPFEITEAERLVEAGNEERPEMDGKTDWFGRHGWEPHTTLDALPPAERGIVESRLERTAASRELSLLEQPTYKRRWYRPDHGAEEREAMDLWLADRIEAWARERKEPFTIRQAAAALRADAALLAVGELLTGRPDFDVDALVGERVRADAVSNTKHHVFTAEGLLKRAAWEETWRLQHLEDEGRLPLDEDGKPIPIPVPRKYDRTDYQRPEFWSLRGKLDVPKERFIAFTEVPPPVGEETLYGWAGWTHRERARVLLALDEQLENAGVPVADRYGVLHGVWFLLPYVAWESQDAARDFRADVKSIVGEAGVTEAMLAEWAGRSPLTKPKTGGRGKGKKA
ncbi:BREX-2 system adenine-specific DNA-methyltransferase PglX [Sorangium sp. So ce119]|uniref:BREX-2 system adenine-specific DNA-methyltransferase PglX n=1 Tax=Sorangium sp. So ce119 TaxID=3133279 RepID=UPI003F635736